MNQKGLFTSLLILLLSFFLFTPLQAGQTGEEDSMNGMGPRVGAPTSRSLVAAPSTTRLGTNCQNAQLVEGSSELGGQIFLPHNVQPSNCSVIFPQSYSERPFCTVSASQDLLLIFIQVDRISVRRPDNAPMHGGKKLIISASSLTINRINFASKKAPSHRFQETNFFPSSQLYYNPPPIKGARAQKKLPTHKIFLPN